MGYTQQASSSSGPNAQTTVEVPELPPSLRDRLRSNTSNNGSNDGKPLLKLRLSRAKAAASQKAAAASGAQIPSSGARAPVLRLRVNDNGSAKPFSYSAPNNSVVIEHDDYIEVQDREATGGLSWGERRHRDGVWRDQWHC